MSANENAVERWRAMGEKAKGEYDRMAGFPGSGYVSRLGKEMVAMADALDHCQRKLKRERERRTELSVLLGFRDRDLSEAREVLETLRPVLQALGKLIQAYDWSDHERQYDEFVDVDRAWGELSESAPWLEEWLSDDAD